MAVIDLVPGVEVSIIVAGEKATEYNDDDAANNDDNPGGAMHTCNRYIEARTDAEFAIDITTTKAFQYLGEMRGICAEIISDGQSLGAHWLYANGAGTPHRISTVAVASSVAGHLVRRRFKFSAVTTGMF